MKKKSKRGRKAMKIFAVIVGGLFSINIIGYILTHTVFKNELTSIKPYGELVEVNGGRMHVYSMGNGKETIVLLPGWGVPLPSADFGPLMRKLSEEYTVVTVEYFGIGFSDETDSPRTNENYIDEIRKALHGAGFKAPYILMPHSASGVYAEYYAIKYPKEVSSIVMLDTTSTAEISEMPVYINLIYSIAKFQQNTGVSRINSRFAIGPKSIQNGYTEKERRDYKLFNNHVLNETIINQSLLLMDNIKEVNSLSFPEGIPVLKIISEQSINKVGIEYQDDHLARLGNNVSYEIIDATHMLYETKTSEIAEITKQFLSDKIK